MSSSLRQKTMTAVSSTPQRCINSSIKIYSLVDLPLPNNKDTVIKASEEFNEMLKITPDDYIDELKAVEYVLTALNGKIDLMNLVDSVDYKDNAEKVKKKLDEAIAKLNTSIENGESVDEIKKHNCII